VSIYVEWLNLIKLKADYEWLTDAQRKAFTDIIERWPAEVFVCLYGPSGCGKSFIARLLAKDYGFVYTSELKEVKPDSQNVVVDGEEYTRLMRATAQYLGLKRVVVLTRQPPRDPMPRTQITLDEHDVKQFQHNLTKYGVIQSSKTDAEGIDLGQILRAEAIKRGEANDA
jgi:ABC-type cobalamin/Fe3+-siderophores transport system ATPase subunit